MTIKISQEFNNLQQAMMKKMFSSFSGACISENPEIRSLKADFYQLANSFNKNGMHDVFCSQTQELASQLEGSGNLKLANILVSELGKFCSRKGNPQMAEFVFTRALSLSEKMGDKIHMVARYTDLEMLYREIGDKKALYRTLKGKINSLKEIIKDYETSAANFNSISKEPTKLESLKTQLAFAYSDLADMLKYSKLDDAIKLVKKSKALYEEMGKSREVKYLEVKIEKLNLLKQRLNEAK